MTAIRSTPDPASRRPAFDPHRRSGPLHGLEQGIQVAQFVIDRDPQGLKGLRRRVDSLATATRSRRRTAPNHRANDLRELGCRLYRRALANGDNFPGDRGADAPLRNREGSRTTPVRTRCSPDRRRSRGPTDQGMSSGPRPENSAHATGRPSGSTKPRSASTASADSPSSSIRRGRGEITGQRLDPDRIPTASRTRSAEKPGSRRRGRRARWSLRRRWPRPVPERSRARRAPAVQGRFRHPSDANYP